MKRLAVFLAAMFLSICLVHALPCFANVPAFRHSGVRHKRSTMKVFVDKAAAKEHNKAFEAKVAAWREKAKNADAGRGGSHE